MSARTRLDGQGGGSEGMLQWRRRWRKRKGRGVGWGGTEAPLRFTHTEGSAGKDRTQSKSESEVGSLARTEVVSTAVGQTGSSQGLHSRSHLARVKQPNFMRRRFLLQTIPSTHLNLLLLLLFDLAG
jgi:hypothetical protein